MSLSARRNKDNSASRKSFITVKELVIFAMLASIMFCSKKVMEGLPNIHLVGVLTIVYTVVYRFKALIPLYLYVFLDGLFGGFGVWWIPYLYIWTVLWGITMLLPRKMPKWLGYLIYPTLCALHGLAFGILYAPAQALFFNLNFAETISWIASGFAFDIIHAIGNLTVGLLAVPLIGLLNKLNKTV